MINIHSDNAVAKTDTDVSQIRQRIVDTLHAAAAQDMGLVEDLAPLFREDPHQAERDWRDAVFGLARELLGQTFGALNDHGDRLQIDGKRDHQVAASDQAMTLFGAMTFQRARLSIPTQVHSQLAVTPVRPAKVLEERKRQ